MPELEARCARDGNCTCSDPRCLIRQLNRPRTKPVKRTYRVATRLPLDLRIDRAQEAAEAARKAEERERLDRLQRNVAVLSEHECSESCSVCDQIGDLNAMIRDEFERLVGEAEANV